jgi:surface protein
MKTSKPSPSKTTSSTNASTTNTCTTNAPDDHGGDGFLGAASGETASAAAPSSLAPLDAPPTRERVCNGDDLHRKPKSTPGQDVSRPGAYHETYVTPSIASATPPRNPNQGFNKDEFARHSLGETAASPSTLAPADVAARRDWRFNRDEYNRNVAGETPSAVAPSSSIPPDAPTGERGYELDQFQGKFSSSATEDQEPADEDYSQPGACRVAETLDRTIGETYDVEKVTALPPVPELRGQYLAEATLVSQHDVLIGEIVEEPKAIVVEPNAIVEEPKVTVEEPKALWKQPKVQRLAFFVLLLVIGVVVSVVVAVGRGSTKLAPTPAPTLAPTPAPFSVFETKDQLRNAANDYLADNSEGTLVALTYGWPIGVWDVSKIQDFSYLFATALFGDGESLNTDAANFNEDITLWDVSSATTMRSMFEGATSFNQPIGNWNVSSVTSTEAMFEDATSFNQPIGNWIVSSVTNMAFMFFYAASFDQPLADWDVSSATTMIQMFEGAASFNQPLADWNVFSVTDMEQMFFAAASFNQALGNWNRSSVTDFTFQFDGSGCPGAEGEQSCF